MRSLITNALVFDGHQDGLIADHVIGIEHGRIVHFAREAWDKAPDRTIDAGGKVLMPGLIDAHYHAYAGIEDFFLLEQMPQSYLAHHARNVLGASLNRGFTTVRDVAGGDYGIWRAVEEGVFAGPRFFFGDKALSQTGGHGDVRKAHEGHHQQGCSCCNVPGVLSRLVDGEDAVRKAAREIMRRGAHHIKIMASGGVSSPTDPVWMTQFSEGEITAIVEEASRWRGYVAAHSYGADAIMRAARLGVRSFEHGNFIDAEAAAVVAENHAFVVPTLTAYEDFPGNDEEGNTASDMGGLDEFRRAGREAIALCVEAGVKLGFGTDLFGDGHQHQLQEFRTRSDVQKPYDVLRSATGINAEILQRPDDIGCVKQGAFADLILIDGNPLEDLSLFYGERSAVSLVMKEGQIVRHDAG